MMKMYLMSLSMQTMLYKNHMIMLIYIMASCLFMSSFMFLMSLNSWLSFMVILIYISGIMVMFMFIASLAPNEKSLMKNQKKNQTFIFMSLLILFQMKMKNSEKFKMNSTYFMNTMMMMMMIFIIATMSYLPPKILLMLYKGMKSSK